MNNSQPKSIEYIKLIRECCQGVITPTELLERAKSLDERQPYLLYTKPCERVEPLKRRYKG